MNTPSQSCSQLVVLERGAALPAQLLDQLRRDVAVVVEDGEPEALLARVTRRLAAWQRHGITLSRVDVITGPDTGTKRSAVRSMLGHVVLDAMRGAEAPVLSFHGAPHGQEDLFSVVDTLRPQLPGGGQIRLCMAAAPAQVAAQVAEAVPDTRQVA